MHGLQSYSRVDITFGGVRILNPSARAIPDFVLITATKCIHFATHGLQLLKELHTIPMPPTLAQLFDSTANTTSTNLQCFHHLLPTIASYATPKTSQNPTNTTTPSSTPASYVHETALNGWPAHPSLTLSTNPLTMNTFT